MAREFPCRICEKTGEFERTYVILKLKSGNKKVAVCPEHKHLIGSIRSQFKKEELPGKKNRRKR